MSRTLVRSEQACRRRVWHLDRVLRDQLAGRSLVLDRELLNEIKQEIAQQRSGRPGEHEPQSDEDREDDDTMKLVIWKFYQRHGVLDPAVTEAHEGMTEALGGLDWISPRLLELAAKTFLKRRAATP